MQKLTSDLDYKMIVEVNYVLITVSSGGLFNYVLITVSSGGLFKRVLLKYYSNKNLPTLTITSQ